MRFPTSILFCLIPILGICQAKAKLEIIPSYAKLFPIGTAHFGHSTSSHFFVEARHKQPFKRFVNYSFGVLVHIKKPSKFTIGSGLLFTQRKYRMEQCRTCSRDFIIFDALLRFIELPLYVQYKSTLNSTWLRVYFRAGTKIAWLTKHEHFYERAFHLAAFLETGVSVQLSPSFSCSLQAGYLAFQNRLNWYEKSKHPDFNIQELMAGVQMSLSL